MFYFKFLKNNQKKTSKSQELKYFFNVDQSTVRLAGLYVIYYVTVVQPGQFGQAQDGDTMEWQI